MPDYRPAIAIDTKVLFHPRRHDANTQVIDFTSPREAAHVAAGIRAVQTERFAITADTPFWQIAMRWMWAGSTTLKDTSFPSYRSDILLRLLPHVGHLPARFCDEDAYQSLFDQLGDAGASESMVRCSARTLGAICTWVAPESRWPLDRPPFGAVRLQRKVKEAAFKKARTLEETGPIRICHVPSWDEMIEFCADLRAAAVDRYGSDADYIGDLPLIQYVTSKRWGEALVAKASDFRLGECTVATTCQYDKRRRWEAGVVDPPTTITKNGSPRTSVIWEEAVGLLEPIVARAAERPGGYLFPRTNDQLHWDDRLYRLYQDTQRAVGYQYTSHFHRHAYVTWNLATVDEGGYGRSIRKVAEWIGHTRVSETSERYWHPTEDEPGWSRHLPGSRAAA